MKRKFKFTEEFEKWLKESKRIINLKERYLFIKNGKIISSKYDFSLNYVSNFEIAFVNEKKGEIYLVPFIKIIDRILNDEFLIKENVEKDELFFNSEIKNYTKVTNKVNYEMYYETDKGNFNTLLDFIERLYEEFLNKKEAE